MNTNTPVTEQRRGPQEAPPRYQRAERRQMEWRPLSLDQMLRPEHSARLVWAYVDSLDLSELYEQIRAVEGHVGRNPIDPKILVTLWLYASKTKTKNSPKEKTRSPAAPEIAMRWRRGGNGWERPRPRRFTNSGRPRRSFPTPAAEIADCVSSWCAGCRRPERSVCGTPWPTTSTACGRCAPRLDCHGCEPRIVNHSVILRK